MVHNTKEITNTERRMDLVHSFGLTNLLTKVILWTITYMVMELTNGLTIESIPAIGLTIKCTELVYSHGLTVENTMENITTTRSKDMECLPGLITDSTMDTG